MQDRLDYVSIAFKQAKDGKEAKPKFKINYNTKDLIIRDGIFCAAWIPKKGLWSTNEQDVVDTIDEMIDEAIAKRLSVYPDEHVIPMYMSDPDSGSIDRWHKYVQKQMIRTKFHVLDQKVIFSNQEVKKSDYVSKTLTYPIEDIPTPAYDELSNTLYYPEERQKYEWGIGAVIAGEVKKIHKFFVFYGDRGTGKSTILDIIESLFGGEDGFVVPFFSKDLGSSANQFSLEAFKNAPLVGIDNEGKLNRIEDNTKLNSLVAHDRMILNPKYEKQYPMRFNTLLFIASNEPVKITDAKSGLLRRLIDINPTGNKIPRGKYDILTNQVQFELPGIAYHCLHVYKELGHSYYDDYVPRQMMAATNDFYNFVDYYYDEFVKDDVTSLRDAWALYQSYCEYAGSKPMLYMSFRNELKNYFAEFKDRASIGGRSVRSVYIGFKKEKFTDAPLRKDTANDIWIDLKEQKSLFDELFANEKAQIVTRSGIPFVGWDKCMGRLKDIDTKHEHFVKPSDIHLICIDFDILGEDGEKSLELSIKEAATWPKTYCETSRSGKALHLYYIYRGDVEKLKSIFKDHVEIKTLCGNSSFRRKLYLCNDIPIATLEEGSLPLKEESTVVDWNGYKNEEHLHNKIVQTIEENLKKNRGGSTTESINFIKAELDKAYESGMHYDVSALYDDVLKFAMHATNQKEKCVNMVGLMRFKSDDISDSVEDEDDDRPITFFDWEVYPNFNCVVYKNEDVDSVVKIPFPKPEDARELMKKKIVGFNNLNYDNAITVARERGYSDKQLYNLSKDIVEDNKNPFRESKNISYCDAYDVATEKMGLKKWEYKLGKIHDEMPIPWDEPVPEEMFERIMQYCENDVRATEAVWKERQGDVNARKIQVAIAKALHGNSIKVCMNDTTNTLSKRIIFGNNKHPQVEFNYRDYSKPVGADKYEYYREHFGADYRFRVFDDKGLPLYRDYIPGEKLPDGYSILPFWPTYTFDKYAKTDKSHCLGESVGEGGKNHSIKGYWTWVLDLDINSQYPNSMKGERYLGPNYQPIYDELVEARVAVKHKDFETAGKLLGGALKPYLSEETYKDLAQALKIVINSVYGLTAASFDNEFRDPRNIDNFVAKRGSLFMTTLKQEVEKRGFKVCHIKTDSIKIPNATEEIKEFCMNFAKEYGYIFDVEAIFSKFVIFNDSAYCGWDTVEGKWITKAEQFKKEKQPYLYKTLFSHEPYVFDDFCEVKSVQKGALYLDLNEDLPDVTEDEKMHDKIVKKLSKAGIAVDPNVYADTDDGELQSLREKIRAGHNYKFVGRVGRFTPVLPGVGGGALYRFDGGKYNTASGTTGYLWLESENVRNYGKEDWINYEYYTRLVDKAKEDIGKYVDPEYFLSDAQPEEWYGRTMTEDEVREKFGNTIYISPDFMNIPEGAGEELPWSEVS